MSIYRLQGRVNAEMPELASSLHAVDAVSTAPGSAALVPSTPSSHPASLLAARFRRSMSAPLAGRQPLRSSHALPRSGPTASTSSASVRNALCRLDQTQRTIPTVPRSDAAASDLRRRVLSQATSGRDGHVSPTDRNEQGVRSGARTSEQQAQAIVGPQQHAQLEHLAKQLDEFKEHFDHLERMLSGWTRASGATAFYKSEVSSIHYEVGEALKAANKLSSLLDHVDTDRARALNDVLAKSRSLLWEEQRWHKLPNSFNQVYSLREAATLHEQIINA